MQVVSADGQVLAADEELRGQGPMADFGPGSTASGDSEDDDGAESESGDGPADEDDPDEDDADDADDSASEEDGSPGSGNVAPGTYAGLAADAAAHAGPADDTASTTEPVFGQAQLTVGDTEPATYRIAALTSTTPDGRPVTSSRVPRWIPPTARSPMCGEPC